MKIKYWFLTTAVLMLCGCMQRYYNTATNEEETYFYSTDKEVKIGESLSRQIEREFKPDNDILIQQRIDQIGQKLVLGNERKDLKYHFKVLDVKDINAVALPGGYVYIFKGLWGKIEKDDAKIAAVLAHEIAHISARHTIKRLQASLGVNVLSVLIAVSPNPDPYSKSQAMAGIWELMLAYSREDELQADFLATKYMQQSGYDLSAVLDVLQVLQEEQRSRPARNTIVQTHPYISERKKVVKQQINRGNIGFDDYINTSSD
ncbi:MAG: M48 family metalloprotease [Candidatus Omnitrophota bacterium]